MPSTLWAWLFNPGYEYSVNEGVAELVKFLNNRYNYVVPACARETFILGGYSQGADVIRRALLGLGGTLTPSARSHIGYVALYADPSFVGPSGQINGCDRGVWVRGDVQCRFFPVTGRLIRTGQPYMPSDFSGRFGSWCSNYDGVCAFDVLTTFGPGLHDSIYRDQWISVSASEIVDGAVRKVNETNPDRPPVMGDSSVAVVSYVDPRPSGAPPIPWSFENLDGDAGAISPHDANLGAQPATVEFNGQMYAFYYDVDGGNLRYARTSPGWVFDILDGAGGGVGQVNGNVGQTPAVAVYGNTMHALYYDAGNGNLRHAWTGNGTNWNFENFDGAPGSVCGLNADLGQTPTLIAYGGTLQALYYDATHGNLRHAWADQNGWHCENLEGDPYTISGRDANIGLDPVLMVYGNTLQALYYDATTGNLRHAWVDPTTGWHFENLDGDPASICGRDGDIGKNPTLTVYGQTLQAFYYDQSHGDLRHAWVDPVTGWHCETLDGDAGSVVGYDSDVGATPVAVAYGNTLQVFAYEPRWGALRHYWLDTSWHGENLDGFGGQANRINGNVGIDPAAVVVGGYLHVLYYDVQYGNLRHVRPN